MAKYTFGKSVLKKSAGEFAAFVKDRYPKVSDKEVKALVEEHYGKDKGAEKLTAGGNNTASAGKGKDPQ